MLNQIQEERLDWLVPGMLKEKILALLKSLPQRPRSRFVPLPDSAARLAGELSAPEYFGSGSLTEALLKKVEKYFNDNLIYPRRYFHPSLNNTSIVDYSELDLFENLSTSLLIHNLYLEISK